MFANAEMPKKPRRPRREFSAEFWAGDITCVWTDEGWLYLAVVLDLFSLKAVDWATGKRMDRSLVLSALDMALLGRPAPTP